MLVSFVLILVALFEIFVWLVVIELRLLEIFVALVWMSEEFCAVVVSNDSMSASF